MNPKITAKLPLIIIITALVALLTVLYWPETEEAATKKVNQVKVTTVTVEKVLFRDIIEALGTAKANEAVTLYPEYSAIVKQLHFSGGELINKGQNIVTLDNSEQQAKVQELTAQLTEAKRQLIRLENLKKTNSSAESTIDKQRSEVETIQAQLAQEKAILAKYTITAPFTGVLGMREISEGALLSSTDKITTLDDLSKIKVDFSLPEKDLTKVKINQNIDAFSVAYDEQKFIGKITHIDSRVDPITRSINVRAIINNQELLLKPGMLLSIQLERSVSKVIVLPESAIIPTGDKQWVFVAQNGQAIKKEVKVGRRQTGIIEIISGLSLGEQVVTQGTLKLRDGTEIMAIPAENIEE